VSTVVAVTMMVVVMVLFVKRRYGCEVVDC